jgi:hypothetical protein
MQSAKLSELAIDESRFWAIVHRLQYLTSLRAAFSRGCSVERFIVSPPLTSSRQESLFKSLLLSVLHESHQAEA